ncbi:hypothetical protein J4Q44_G00290150 [Coregonus suidteri]|uniref:Ig-like domain-containing protein n=1 Tax=Coregonus suidteri TaxID=861788 RepID=A0AAN8KXX6_9TELE
MLMIRYPDRCMQRTPPSPQRTNPRCLNTSSASQYASSGGPGAEWLECDIHPSEYLCLEGVNSGAVLLLIYPRSYTVKTTFWFTKLYAVENYVSLSNDPDYKGRVTYHRDTNGNTLTITDLRESDSATYKFRLITDQTGGSYTGDPGVTLSVTDLQVKVTPYKQTATWKTLTCSTTSCPLTGNPTYIWYKNGQIVTDNTSPYSVYPDAADSYSCAVKGCEALHSPAVYKPKNTSVSVSPSGEIVEGSSVTLTCSSDANPPVQSNAWWRFRGGSEATGDTGDTQSVHPDSNSDTYTALNMKTRSPEYDTLAGGGGLESIRLVIRYPDRWMQRTPPSPQRTNPIGLNTSSASQYASTGSPCPSLWVGNVTVDLTEKHIWDLFKTCGEIESIRVLHERLCAFINFKNANMAALALERLQVSDGMKHNAVKMPSTIGTGAEWLECDLHPSEYLYLEGVNSGHILLLHVSQLS